MDETDFINPGMARSRHAYIEDSTHSSSGLSRSHEAQTYRPTVAPPGVSLS